MFKKEAFICCINYCSKDGGSGKKYLGIFTYSRMKVKKFVEHKWFDNFVLMLIIASSLVLVGSKYFHFKGQFPFIHLGTGKEWEN